MVWLWCPWLSLATELRTEKCWWRCFVLSPLRPSRTDLTPHTKIHIRTLFRHQLTLTSGGGGGGGGESCEVFWSAREFSKSDNTNQHNGQQCCLAGGAHWNVDNQQLFTSRLPVPPHSFLLFCRVWSFYYYFKIPCNQLCQTRGCGHSGTKWSWPTHWTIVLSLKYWILTVRENIAIKLNLLSSLINFKYRLDLTSTTSGRCLTPTLSWAVSRALAHFTVTAHWPLQAGLLDQEIILTQS